MLKKRGDPDDLDDIGQELTARINERVRETLVGRPRLRRGP